MNSAKLLTLLRSITNDTIKACQIGEYTPDAIFRIHNEKVLNVNNIVRYNQDLNKKVKLKYFAEIRKISLDPCRNKGYDVIRNQLMTKAKTLTGCITLSKR
ncbi:hypothetical protein [Klebsiella phage 05F01]|nr:hypothetical protein [Klebsiella phage 05F01]